MNGGGGQIQSLVFEKESGAHAELSPLTLGEGSARSAPGHRSEVEELRPIVIQLSVPLR